MRLAAQRFLGAAALAVGLIGPATAQAVFLGDIGLDIPSEPRFGGLSAVEVLAGGREALVLSDRGTLFRLTLSRNDGRIVGAGLIAVALIRGQGGAEFPEAARDTEGLARLSGGRVAISFEGQPSRVAVHSLAGIEQRVLPPVPGADGLPRNGGFEGLAVDARGRFNTIPEALPGTGPIPLLRFQGGQWSRAADLPRGRGWSPVALDFDAEGRLYVLERRAGAGSFASRLTRYTVGAQGVGNAERLFQTRPGAHGNLEGLSVWRNSAGQLIATMVSDDNFTSILRTTFVEYLLPN